MSESTATLKSTASRYLVCTLAREKYGIAIGMIEEVIPLLPVTPVPNMPEFIKGVINLRGVIVPVIDLRVRFGMPHSERARDTCVLILKVNTGEGRIRMGAIVDAVQDVAQIPDDQIEPAPEFGVRVDTRYLFGMGKDRTNKVILLLDIEKALTDEEFKQIETAAGIE